MGVVGGDVSRQRLTAAIIAIALIGLALRVLTLRSERGLLNADEAYTGVEAYEVLAGRFPVVLGGTAYTAVFEAYIYAPIAAVIGGDVIVLKSIAIVMWAVACVVIAVAAAELSPRHPTRTALIAGALAWITPGALLTISTLAYAGYASGMAVIAATFLLARRVIDADAPGPLALATVGLLAGIGFWMHPMFLSVLVPICLYVLVVHRRVTRWAALIVGGLVGCGPFLVWNAVNRFPSRRLPAEFEGTYLERLGGFVTELLPRAFGLRSITMHWYGPVGPLLGIALGALLVALAIVGVVAVVRSSTAPSRWLLAAVLVACLPMMALFPPLVYTADGRYAIIVFPFLVVAVALGISHLFDRLSLRLGAVTLVGVVGVWMLAFVVPDARPIFSTTARTPNADNEALVALLDDAGIAYVYGSYWRVLPIDFLADRRVTSAVLPPLPARFDERQATVLTAPPERVAWVLEPADDRPENVSGLAPWLGADAYRRSEIGSTVVYLPRG